MTDRVEVVGTGVVHVPPDVLEAHLAAEALAADVATALGQARSAAEAMTAQLRDRGVAERDVQTAEMMVNSYREGKDDPDIVRAWLGIRVTLRDLATAGDTLAAVLTAGRGEARVQQTVLSVSDPSEALTAARTAAFADARAQAEQLAALAERELGVVSRVSSPAEISTPLGGTGQRVALQAAPLALAVEPGTSSVSASVVVRFELR